MVAQCRKKNTGLASKRKLGPWLQSVLLETLMSPISKKQLGPVPETKYWPKAGKTMGPGANKITSPSPVLKKQLGPGVEKTIGPNAACIHINKQDTHMLHIIYYPP